MDDDATTSGYHSWHQRPSYFGDYLNWLSDAGRTLDVGCGVAWLSEYVADYRGMEVDAAIVAACKELQRNVFLGSAEEPWDLADREFDTVIMMDVVEHLRHPELAVKEAVRVLRPGGRLIVTAPDAQRAVWDDYSHVRPHTKTSLSRLAIDSDAKVDKVFYEPVMPGVGRACAKLHLTHRPRLLWWLARSRRFRRNIVLFASKP